MTETDWRPAALYQIAEPQGYVRAYRQATESPGDLRALTRTYPFYNKPLFHRFADEPTADLAHEMFLRRIFHDSDGTTRPLDGAAKVLRKQRYPLAEPIEPLVRQIAEEGAENVALGEAYFAAGPSWEAAGDTGLALVSYENAVHEYGLQHDWHESALGRTRALTEGDFNYTYHVTNAFS
ncbi:hypothetical protein ACFQO7_32075 [Catellatospora aurea]|uniref:Uncharacterized protein n=1 Tax=Catellatospora aurea TaxID=1337874 RepID=A0ABW2H5E1_9ACTN